jgi:hypothetical protein
MLTGEGIVKIADLGIAKSFEEGSIGPDAAGKRKVLGTPHYMAPEQALGKAIDRRADVYSLGATFYHMLTGKTPFKGSTIAELLRAHVHEKLAPIQMLNSEVPEPVCFIVERMMAKSPEKRYENMTRLLEDLNKVSTDAPVNIERLPPEESSIMAAAEAAEAVKAGALAVGVRRPRAANPTINLVVMIVALLLVLGVLIGSFLLVRTVRRKRQQEEQQQQTVVPIPDNTQGPPESEAARLLREAEQALAGADEAGALQKATIIRDKFAGEPEAKRAAEIIATVEDRQKRLLAKEISEAVDRARQFERDNPGEPGKWITEWQRILVVDRFRGTEAEKTANERIAQLRADLTRVDTAKRRDEFNKAVANSDRLAGEHDYVPAVQELETFIAGHDKESDEVKRAQARAKEIADYADKLFKDAEEGANKALAGDSFARAIKILQDLKATVKSAKWMDGVPAKIDAIKAQIKAAYDADAAKVLADVKAGKLDDAGRKAWALARRFRDSEHAKAAADLKAGLENMPKLRDRVVAAVAKLGPRELKEKMDAALFPGVTWKVVAADDEKVTLEARKSGLPMGSTLYWSKTSAPDVYRIYRLYLDNPTKEDHRDLAFFCEVNGLANEAEEHRKQAQ